MKTLRIVLLAALVIAICSPGLQAQKKPARKTVKVTSKVVDESMKPLKDVAITGNDGRLVTYTNSKGEFTLSVYEQSTLLIEAEGYEERLIPVKTSKIENPIIVGRMKLFVSPKDVVTLPMTFSATRREMTGAIATVQGADLQTYPDAHIFNSLQGRLPGLTVIQKGNGTWGQEIPQLYLRGISSLTNYNPVVLVDGIERTADGIMAEEIEDVTILKDATAKILYGPRAANGVVMIKTKRGLYNRRVINISAEMGTMLPTRMPEWIDAAQYATLYNEALYNDGMPQRYSYEKIQRYKASQGCEGTNSILYPNVDYNDYFLRESGNYRKVSTQFLGGTTDMRYALVAAYNGNAGLENVGQRAQADRINVRGNLDLRVTNSLSVFMDVAGRLEMYSTADMTVSDLFTSLSTHRPNEYPIHMYLDGTKLLGASDQRDTNLYGEMAEGGYRRTRYSAGQTNIGFDLSLSKIIKGLGVKAYITLDNYSMLQEQQNLVSATYIPKTSISPDGLQHFKLIPKLEQVLQGDSDVRTTNNLFNIGYFAAIGYKLAKKKHDLDLSFNWGYMTSEQKGSQQDIQNLNVVFQAKYALMSKLYFEGDVAMMGTNRFHDNDNYAIFPAAGLGWIISEESFMRNVRSVDFLKLRGSFGIIGYDGTTPTQLYERRWSKNGSFGLYDNDSSLTNYNSPYDPNENLKWEKSQEINVGLDLLMFNRKLNVTLDVFDNYRYDIIGQIRSNFPATAGFMVPYQNWGEVRNRGFEVAASWTGRTKSDFRYTISASAAYSKSKVKRTDEVDYTGVDAGRSMSGQPVDAIWGYRSMGLFDQTFNQATYPFQSMGQYGPGDIRYEDVNGDNIIDGLDMRPIGKSLPTTVLTLSANLNYKGFGLYVLGLAHLGASQLLNNAYYWNYGEGKYSVQALNRWHETENVNGTYPRLTTMNSSNNFIASDFWVANADFFRLKNVELSYTYATRKTGSWYSKLKFFARGANLWTISGIKDLDPEDLAAGVSYYPMMTTITGGATITF